jgi:hypothetical protein
MRYGLVGLLSAMALASTMMTAGCSGGDDDDAADTASGGAVGTGGADGTTGGAVGTGGLAAGVGGGGANPVTTVNSAATLSALSETEVTQLCDEAYAYYGTAIPTAVFCKWRGLKYATSSSPHSDQQLIDNCSSTEATCLADPAAALADNSGCNNFPATCGATVADYTACIMDLAAAFTVTVNAIPDCSVLTMDDTAMVWEAQGADAPASCDFSATCQGLYPPNPLL